MPRLAIGAMTAIALLACETAETQTIAPRTQTTLEVTIVQLGLATEKPLPGTTVKVKQGNSEQTKLTQPDGRASFTGLTAGIANVQYGQPGFSKTPTVSDQNLAAGPNSMKGHMVEDNGSVQVYRRAGQQYETIAKQFHGQALSTFYLGVWDQVLSLKDKDSQSALVKELKGASLVLSDKAEFQALMIRKGGVDRNR